MTAQLPFEDEVLLGLKSSPKRLSSRFFYDDIGSQIFQKITSHPDYYLTSKEHEILQKHSAELCSSFTHSEIDIIELGVGDGHKTVLLLNAFIQAGKKVNFYPIDISSKAMDLLKEQLPVHESLNTHAIIGDFFDGFDFVKELSKGPKLVLFLGSNIGNFNRESALNFLNSIYSALSIGDSFFCGFDLKKDLQILHQAYNDSAGYTRDFNLNLLTRINKECGANFELKNFFHYGSYNPTIGAMESFIIAKNKHSVQLSKLNIEIHFDDFEAIHVEYSHKYSQQDIESLCQESGFNLVKHFSDSQQYFIDSLWCK